MLLNSIRNRIRALGRSRQILRAHGPIFANHPDFDLMRARQGFAHRGSLSIRPDHLQRIVAAYGKAKSAQKQASPEYQVSNEWLPIYRDQFQGAIDLLNSGNIDGVREMFENFFRDDISTGLHGMPTDMKKAYFSESISDTNISLYLIDALHRLSVWQRLLPGHSPAELTRPNIGNPYGFFSGDEFITPGAEYQHYYANKTCDILRSTENPTVLELGGGYGGYAYFLHKLGKNIKYINLDLPEVLSISTFYLMTSFPDSKFILFGEQDYDSVSDYDFMMLPNFEISRLATRTVDFIFNSYSLGEMSAETIKTYVSQFKRLEPQFLMHVNHTKFAVLGAESFGLEESGFRNLERIKTEWNLGRQLDMDEDMFFYDYPAKTL